MKLLTRIRKAKLRAGSNYVGMDIESLLKDYGAKEDVEYSWNKSV